MIPKRSEKIIRDNAAKGKAGERRVRDRYERAGYKVERTGQGHDFKVTRINPITGEKEIEYLEVKTGDAELSSLQKRKERSLGTNYVVVNGDPVFRSGLVSKGAKPAGPRLPSSPSKALPKPAWLGPSGSPSKGRSTKSAGFNLPSIRLGGPKPAWLGPSGSPSKGRSTKSAGFNLPSIRLGGPKPAWLGPSGSPSKGRSKKSSGSVLFGSTSHGRRSRAPKWTI